MTHSPEKINQIHLIFPLFVTLARMAWKSHGLKEREERGVREKRETDLNYISRFSRLSRFYRIAASLHSWRRLRVGLRNKDGGR